MFVPLIGDVAQTEERGSEKPCVGGSIPPVTTGYVAEHNALVCNTSHAGELPVISSI